MKLETRTGLLLLFMALQISCNKDFLNVPVQGQPGPGSDPRVAENLVTGVYSSLIYIDPGGGWNSDTHGISFVAATDIRSDDADKGSYDSDQPGIKELDDFTETPANSFVAALWNGYYAGISRANNALAALAVSALDTATVQRLEGEVRFIRGYYYFNLVRFFGGVPIVLNVPSGPRQAVTDSTLVTRASVSDVYNKVIIPDLEYAMNHLPLKSQAEVGRITKGAAESMLAKVYLYLQNWQMAYDLSRDVIQSGQYQLVPDYASLFREAGDNDAESIFEIETGEYGNTDSGIPLYSEFQGPRNASGIWHNPGFPDPTGDRGWGFCTPSQSLVDAFEPGDERKAATIIFSPQPPQVGDTLWDGYVIPVGTQNKYYNYKAYHSEKLESFYGNRDREIKNVKILRYAEVLLINAEAANALGKTSEALQNLNQVRERAGLPDVTGISGSQLRDTIWHERRVELALEHDRFFDLVRQEAVAPGRIVSIFQAQGQTFVKGKNELLPIPATQIALSGGRLTQNPGY